MWWPLISWCQRCRANQPRLARTFTYGTSILYAEELAGHLHSALALPSSDICTLLGVEGSMLLTLCKAAEFESITTLTFASKYNMEDSSELKIPLSTIYKTKKRKLDQEVRCWGTCT
jgi:hypothetical protein